MRCLTDKETIELMSGFLAQEKAADAFVHVERCKPCAERLREFKELRDGIGAGEGEFQDSALCEEIMTLIELGRGKKARLPGMRRAFPWNRWTAVAAAAAIVLTTTAVFQFAGLKNIDAAIEDISDSGNRHGFASRSGTPSLDQWVSLTLFERRDANGGSTYHPVEASIRKGAFIAAAYEDRSALPFPYLMVFAVDQSGEVFWYYPEYDKNGPDQISIETLPVGGKISLPDEVTHDFSLGQIRFFGVFSKAPLNAALVEATVKRQSAAVQGLSKLTQLPIDDTGQWTLLVEVVEKNQ